MVTKFGPHHHMYYTDSDTFCHIVWFKVWNIVVTQTQSLNGRAQASVIGGLTVRRSWTNINQPSAFNQTHKNMLQSPIQQYKGGEGSQRADFVRQGPFGWGNPLQMCTNHPLLNCHCCHRCFVRGFGITCVEGGRIHWVNAFGFCIKPTNRSVVSTEGTREELGWHLNLLEVWLPASYS